MKKILFVSIDPIENRRRVLNQIEVAIEAGFDAEAISIGKKSQRHQTFKLDHIFIPFKKGPLKFLLFNFILFWRILFKKYELIHFRGLWVLPAILGRQIFNRSVLIYDAHEYFAGLGTFHNRPFTKAIWLWFEQRAISKLNTLITVSEPIADLYRKRYPALKTVQVIRNVPSYHRAVKPVEQEYQFNYSNPVILFHGYFMPHRGLENLLKAIALVDNITLLLVGEGVIESSLHKLVDELKLRKRVLFRPFIPGNLIIDFASQADIGATLLEPVSENHKFALPNKFFEYIMSGLPVLASNIPTMQDYVPRFNVGLTVNPENPREIADGIKEMLTHPGQLKKWKQSCLKASEHLCWEEESRKLFQIYERV